MIRDELRAAGYLVEGDWVEKEFADLTVIRFTGIGALLDSIDRAKGTRLLSGPQVVERMIDGALKSPEVTSAVERARAAARSQGGRCVVTIKADDWQLRKVSRDQQQPAAHE